MLKTNLKTISSIFAIVVVLALSSCSDKIVFEKEISMNNALWNMNNKATFSVPLQDTLNAYNIFLSFENNDDYKYSNIYLFCNIEFPNGQIITDTVEYYIADYHGKWTGEGVSTYKNIAPYKANVRFPFAGTYTFSFEQAMRCGDDGNLEGISAIGLIIKQK